MQISAWGNSSSSKQAVAALVTKKKITFGTAEIKRVAAVGPQLWLRVAQSQKTICAKRRPTPTEVADETAAAIRNAMELEYQVHGVSRGLTPVVWGPSGKVRVYYAHNTALPRTRTFCGTSGHTVPA